jgi:catechol 2,3-dioxygenase-like lactoylglutathione lyase family enzyme
MATKAKKSTKKAARSAAKTSAKKSVKKSAPKKAAARKPAAKAAPKPSGSALVGAAPGFTANDAAATIKWYCDVLGFKVIERWEHEGQFLGAQIGSGNVVINIGQDDWKLGRDRVKGQGTRTYILMGPDVDSYASAIKARGGVLAHEPRDDWGMRAFSINDPDGYKLTFMTTLAK